MIFPLFLKSVGLAIVITIFLVQLGVAQSSVAVQKKSNEPAKSAETLPEVKKIDINGLKALLKPNGKPLLINFWATWCDPCREEFPDLVKIDEEFKGRIDFITVSLDDLADIKTSVPKFLHEMNSKIPAYLLHTPDESAAISLVSKNWSGNLPMTVLFDTGGNIAYSRNGKIRYESVAAEINKLLTPTPTPKVESVGLQEAPIFELRPPPPHTFEEGVADAKRDIANGEYKIVRYGMRPGVAPSKEFDRLLKKYSVTVTGTGCTVPSGFPEYARGYNQTSKAAFEKRFGRSVAAKVGFGE